MVESVVGTRIAERRRQMGVTQSEMARRIGISPSYLNLIERNKRRIAGALLRRTAEELGVRTEDLDGAQERRLAERLSEVATLPLLDGHGVEIAAIPELIARFPGWARALSTLARSERAAQDTARALSDRLTHDPFLGEAVHGMLSRVAAIRSAGEILTEFQDMAAADRRAFDQIVRTEAETLTETGEALVTYFNRTGQTESRLTPLDEIEALFEASANHFAALETPENVSAAIDAILADAPQIETDAARHRAQDRLTSYAADAAAMPVADFAETARQTGCDIEILARTFGTGTDAVCRRLAAMPSDVGLPAFGYFLANASGTIIEMMGLESLTVPRYAATCPLWVLFRAQQQPGTAIAQLAEMPNGTRYVFVAHARQAGTPGYGQPRHYLTDMLAMVDRDARDTVYAPPAGAVAERVGPACRICPRGDCPHRVADPLAG